MLDMALAPSSLSVQLDLDCVQPNSSTIEFRFGSFRCIDRCDFFAIWCRVSILNQGNSQKAASLRIGFVLHGKDRAKCPKVQSQSGFW
jgi:hypothetical protein